MSAKIQTIEDNARARAIIEQHASKHAPKRAPKHAPKRRARAAIVDVGEEAPPNPTADMTRVKYLEADFLRAQHFLKIATLRQSTREMVQFQRRLDQVHAELSTLRKPGGTSIWDADSSEALRALFDAEIMTAPIELLQSAAAELRRRRAKK